MILRDPDYYTQYAKLEQHGFIQTVRIKTIGQKEQVYVTDTRPPSILSVFKRNKPI
jgi:hypothetical protein